MKRDRTQREALRGKLHMILGLIADLMAKANPDLWGMLPAEVMEGAK